MEALFGLIALYALMGIFIGLFSLFLPDEESPSERKGRQHRELWERLHD